MYLAKSKDDFNKIIKSEQDLLDVMRGQVVQHVATEEDTSNIATGGEDIKAVVEDMLASSPIRWDENARFTIIEYTELLLYFKRKNIEESNMISYWIKFYSLL